MKTINFPSVNFKFKTDWIIQNLSSFDKALTDCWEEKMTKGVFRYELKELKHKILEGSYQFFAQLNTDRATKRRKPLPIYTIDQPFDENSFNFTKMKEDEIMFRVATNDDQEVSDRYNYIAINISPLEYGHSLLLPSLYQCLPQILTFHSIEFATDVLLSSYNPALRIAFNGLCAHASVNHLHFHIYYLNIPMQLETIEVQHLSGSCYVLENHVSKGYVFQIATVDHITPILSDVHRLSQLFIQNNIAHNLYMTRGLSFNRAKNSTNITERDCIRIYIWARTHSESMKVIDELTPAACELFGHFLLKTEESFSQFTVEKATDINTSLTAGPFNATKEKVKLLFESKACDTA